MERMTKGGRKIIASVKSYLVTTMVELTAGKLDKKGEEGKMFANVISKKQVPVGSKICLRIAIKKFNGNLLMYLHSFGWIEIESTKIAETFQSNKIILPEDLMYLDYSTLSDRQKIQSFNKYFPTKFEELNKTELMLMAFLDGKDLNEVEKEFSIDKSLKSKIRNHTEKYEKTFVKKLEESLATA
jgi:hypothetical protein